VDNFPVVLNPQAVVVVAQFDLAGLRREAPLRKQKKEPSVDGAELQVVGLRSEKLVLLRACFDTVNLGAFEIPAEFDGVTLERLGQTSAEDSIFLVQRRGGERSPITWRAEITKDATGGEATEDIEDGVRASLGMRWATQGTLTTILTMNTQDKRAGRAKRGRVAETEEKIAVAEIRARRGERGRSGKGICAVDVQICVVHLLGKMMIVKNLVEFGKQSNLTIRSRLVVGLFIIDKELRRIGRRHEIQLPIFVNPFRGSEPECFVPHHGATASEVIVPAQEVRDVGLAGDVGTVERAVTVISRRKAVYVV